MPQRHIFYSLIVLVALHGCASAPVKTAGAPNVAAMRVHGVAYYPLVSLCDARNVRLDYDIFSRTAVAKKDETVIRMRVNDELVLVNDEPVPLGYPVTVSRGALVVPQRFKERVWDVFICPMPSGTAVCRLPGLQKIVIDAGHGGRDPGAISRGGAREKDINLDIARRLAALLRQDGIDVVLTRTTDVFIPLEKRSEIAHRSGAEAFVSIHSNSSRRRTLHGFEIFYVSNTAYDSRRARRARANGSINFATKAYAAGPAESGLDTFTQSRARSISLSSSVARSVEKNMGLTILGVKPARFEVLKSAYMPAVLVEVGFLSNAYEERRLQEGFYRQRMAEAIADGIRGYALKGKAKENTDR